MYYSILEYVHKSGICVKSKNVEKIYTSHTVIFLKTDKYLWTAVFKVCRNQEACNNDCICYYCADK